MVAGMADRFYINSRLAPGVVELEGAEAHHLATVCRLRPGDPVCLFNGDGHEYPALVRMVARRAVVVEVTGATTPKRELPFPVEVATPLPKGDRAQFLIEKLTELGVTAFVPLQTARSVVHPGEAKLDRLQRTVVEASKQSGRNVLLRVGPLTSWSEYARKERAGLRRLLAHVGAGALSKASGSAVVLAVGPEGGFTDKEIAEARTAGWEVVGLGPRILRVETAALVLTTWAIMCQ
jgi:16S rRNA (uracil1498-N3)-methyltransferase